jgi:hypothetical protein
MRIRLLAISASTLYDFYPHSRGYYDYQMRSLSAIPICGNKRFGLLSKSIHKIK